MNKKIIFLCTCHALLLGLVGCISDSSDSDNSNNANTSTSTTSKTSSTSTAPTNSSSTGSSSSSSSNVFVNTYWKYSYKIKTTVLDKSDFRQLQFTSATAGKFVKIGYNYTASYSRYYGGYMWSSCCNWDNESAFTYKVSGNIATIMLGGATYTATKNGSSLYFDGLTYSKY